ncbi:22308_t:CDS:2 [Cetraspora pellucida]|uniref:22308_t:CDS:1 n=1 Tax=Cetraspora pellucida TaxID=1433469 RepID=A0A9N9J382_9GLOM|nr:22308_t:CDS:2 [Cetraspora pellucida]
MTLTNQKKDNQELIVKTLKGYFTSYDNLINYVQMHAFSHRYAVSIKRSERENFVYLQCDRVQEMSTAGVYPQTILTTLHQANLNNTAALLDELLEGNFEHYYQYDQEENLTHLFFAHPKLLALTKQKEDYEWALTCVARILDDIPKPQVIVTDHKLALMYAVQKVFPESQNLLYDEWSTFMENWSTFIKSKRETDFENN